MLLQGCSVTTPYWKNKKPIKSSRTTIWESSDTLQKEGVKFIFVRSRQVDSIWYEDSTKLLKMHHDIDSIKRATYLVTSDMPRFQQKQQKGYEFFKGTSFVFAGVILTTGVWWLMYGRN